MDLDLLAAEFRAFKQRAEPLLQDWEAHKAREAERDAEVQAKRQAFEAEEAAAKAEDDRKAREAEEARLAKEAEKKAATGEGSSPPKAPPPETASSESTGAGQPDASAGACEGGAPPPAQS